MKLYNQKIAFTLIGIGLALLIVFTIIKINLDSQAVFLCELVDHDPDLTMSQCPAHEQGNSWYLFLGFGISFVIFVSGTFLLFFDILKPASKSESKKVDLSSLEDTERELVEFINNAEGSVYQSDLVKHFGWSKVKTTRILDKLENKHILERKRRGMTNLVVLK